MQALDLSEALAQIIAHAEPVPRIETVSIDEANGRVVARAVTAPLNLPPFPSSAMDGYACRWRDLRDGVQLTLAGESLAGHPFSGTLSEKECIRITTGASVPASADIVVIQENCLVDAGSVTLTELPQEKGANIRSIGHDVRAGAAVVSIGQRLNALDIGWLAAVGITEIQAYALPRVAVFSTGDELMPPGSQLAAGQIFDSNRFAVRALLDALPATVTDLGVLPDDRETITRSLSEAAQSNDLLLTSGGVSVGDADFVKEVVESLGSIDLWRMNLKPGKPLAFGRVRDTLFVGLPGNPVSTIVTFLLIARPLVLALAGADPDPPSTRPAKLVTAITHNPGREEYQRGILETVADTAWVRITGDQSSNRLATFSGANCLIRVPKESGNLQAGELVEVLPFFGLLN